MALLKDLEQASKGTRASLSEVLDALPYNEQGLIAAIAQDASSEAVLMLAWMDRTAIERTLADGDVWYYSRSRQAYWRKGESSGQVQKLIEFRWDCDGDTVLLLVEQRGVACHTGRKNCFFNAIRDGEAAVIADVEIDPRDLYGAKK